MGTNKIFSLLALLLLLSSCFGSKMASSSGGEVRVRVAVLSLSLHLTA